MLLLKKADNMLDKEKKHTDIPETNSTTVDQIYVLHIFRQSSNH